MLALLRSTWLGGALCCCLAASAQDAAPTAWRPDSITLGDTVLFSTERFEAGAFREVIASYPHTDGRALEYADGGEFVNAELRRQAARVHLRHLGPRGEAWPGPTLLRPGRGLDLEPFAEQGFAGGPDYTVWWVRETVPGADNFARVQTAVYDGFGEQVALRTTAEWERAQVEPLGTLARSSRFGMYSAVAVLTSRRADRLGAQREAGAVLAVDLLGADGALAHHLTAELPDLRSPYRLEGLVVDDAGVALVALSTERWRQRPVTWDDPIVRDYVTVRVGPGTERFTEVPLLPGGRQLRSLQIVDQEPLAPGFAAAYAPDLAQPVEGIALATTAASEPRQVFLDGDALARLPEAAVSPPLGRKLSPEYELEQVRIGADGRLYPLFVDVYAPHSAEDAELFQRVRRRDGMREGLVLLGLGVSDGDGGQSARYQRLRQNTPSPRRGVALVPDDRGGYALLFNEEEANLGPQRKRRGRLTALDFSVPVLAVPVPGGDFAAAPLPYRSPFRFPSFAFPGETIVTPGGIGVGFSPIEDGFREALQYGFFRAHEPVEPVVRP